MGTLRRACARETLEEAGIIVDPEDLYEVHLGPDTGAEGKLLTNVTFRAHRIRGLVEQRKGEGKLARMSPREILAVTPFYDINLCIFTHLHLL